MKAIRTIRERFELIGIGDYDQASRMYPFNVKNLMVLLMFFIDLIINGVFFLDEADGFQEYVNSVFACSTLIVGVLGFAVLIWKMPKIFKFLTKLEETFEKSEH